MKYYMFIILLCISQLNNAKINAKEYNINLTHNKKGFLYWVEHSKNNYGNDFTKYVYELKYIYGIKNINDSADESEFNLIKSKSDLNKHFVKLSDKYINILFNKIIELYSDKNSFVYDNLVINKFTRIYKLFTYYNSKIYDNYEFRNIFISPSDIDYKSLITKEGLFENNLIAEYNITSHNILYDDNFVYYTSIFDEILLKLYEYIKEL